MSSIPPKKGVAHQTSLIGLVSYANTKIYLVSPTMTAGDITVIGDRGTAANITNLPTVDGTMNTRVLISLTAAEMNFDEVSVKFHSAAGLYCDFGFEIFTSARQIDDLAFPQTSGRSLAVGTGGQATVGTLANGVITDAAFTFPAEAAGRPTTFLAWVRRIGEWMTNKRTRDRSTGTRLLRNAADTATLETMTESTAGTTDAFSQGV